MGAFSDDLRGKARDMLKMADEMDALDSLLDAWMRASPEVRQRFVANLSADEVARARDAA